MVWSPNIPPMLVEIEPLERVNAVFTLSPRPHGHLSNKLESLMIVSLVLSFVSPSFATDQTTDLSGQTAVNVAGSQQAALQDIESQLAAVKAELAAATIVKPKTASTKKASTPKVNPEIVALQNVPDPIIPESFVEWGPSPQETVAWQNVPATIIPEPPRRVVIARSAACHRLRDPRPRHGHQRRPRPGHRGHPGTVAGDRDQHRRAR